MSDFIVNIALSVGFAGLFFLYMQHSHKKRVEEAEQRYQLTMMVLKSRYDKKED